MRLLRKIMGQPVYRILGGSRRRIRAYAGGLSLGFKPVANTPDEFGARIRLEMDKWGKVVRDANLRIE